MLKTTDYAMFKFREDNRDVVWEKDVEKLCKSIQAKNLLHLRPITVNPEMEILDGQHRVKAAQKLGLPIYYEITEDLDSSDIITLNVSKAWGIMDYLNYYVKHEYPEYIALKDFYTKHSISIRSAISLTNSSYHSFNMAFKNGTFKFNTDMVDRHFHAVTETIRILNELNGKKLYTCSGKFWTALTKIFEHAYFDEKRWFANLRKLCSRVGPRVSTKDYFRMFADIFNYNARTLTIEEEGTHVGKILLD